MSAKTNEMSHKRMSVRQAFNAVTSVVVSISMVLSLYGCGSTETLSMTATALSERASAALINSPFLKQATETSPDEATSTTQGEESAQSEGSEEAPTPSEQQKSDSSDAQKEPSEAQKSEAEKPADEAPKYEWPRTIAEYVKVDEDHFLTAKVTYGEDAQIPYDAQLKVEVPEANDEHKGAVRELLEVKEGEYVAGYAFAKVTLSVDGKEVQPSKPIDVVVETNYIEWSQSDAIEAALFGNADVKVLSVENLTGKDDAGNESADPQYTRVKLSMPRLGEFGLAAVAAEKHIAEINGVKVSVLGPRAKTVTVDEQNRDDALEEGRELVKIISLGTDPVHAWAPTLWLRTIDGRPEADRQGYVIGRVIREGQLADELFGRDGTTDPVKVSTRDQLGLVWASEEALAEESPVEQAEPDAQSEKLAEPDGQEGREEQAGSKSQMPEAVVSEFSGMAAFDNLREATDGSSFKAYVGYSDQAELSKTAELRASEISLQSPEYLSYMSRAASELGIGKADMLFAKVLDISLVDSLTNQECKPTESVWVRIELLGHEAKYCSAGNKVSVVHFGDQPEVVQSSAADGAVEFAAAGFSVYVLTSTRADNADDASAGRGVEGNLTVQQDQMPLTITARSDEKEYDGEALTLNGYDVEGDLAEGDHIESVTITGSQQDAGESDNVPSDAVILNTDNEDVTENYAITYMNGKLTVTKRPITVQVDDKEKEYGDEDPEFTFRVEDGLVPGDEASDISCQLKRDEGENVGEYRIDVASSDAGNYEVTDSMPGILTINPAHATVTAADMSKVYGAEDPELTATVTGLKNDDAASVISYTVTRDDGEEVGEYDITPSGDEEQSNYIVDYVGATFSITVAEVTVTAKHASKEYGAEDPEFEATIEGLQEGDDESAIDYAFEREAGENVGDYDLTPVGEVVQGNYKVVYKGDKLTITRATATVKAESQTKVYGEEDVQLTAEIEGLTNGDDEGVITYSIAREEGVNVGVYTITPSGEAEQGNYNVKYETAKLTITPALVTVTAESAEKTYGSADPDLTAEVEGLVNGESEDLISYDVTRETGENKGTYTITPTGEARQGNYEVEFATGSLTIGARAVSVTVTGKSDTAVYDGKSHSVSGYKFEITDNDAESLVDESFAYKEEYIRFDGGSAQTSPLVNVGREDMGLAVDMFVNTNENYEVAFDVVDGYQIVTPREVSVTITGKNGAFNYDGQPHTVEGYTATTEDSLYDVAKVSYNGSATVTRAESGTSDMGLTADGFSNNDDNFDTTFNVTDGYITIDAIRISVSIRGNTSSNPYDGTEHAVEGYVASSESNLFDPNKIVFAGTAEATRTDVGTTPMGLVKEDFAYDDSNVSAEFTVTDGSQEITPIVATVIIVGNSDTADYDGEAHTITGYTATADTTLYDVDQDVVFKGVASATQTNVGTTRMGLDADMFSNKNPNFSTVTFTIGEDGAQTIRPITATVTITGNHDSFAYNGKERKVTGYTAEPDTPLYNVENDFTFNGAAEAARTDAGTTSMNLAASQFENTNANFSNVTFEIEDGYVEVTPISATVTITGHNGTFTYDGEEHTVEGYDATFSTELYNEDCFELTSQNADSVSRMLAGVSEMNLGADSFRNISPNFDDVTFEVTDGSITIDPAIIVSKYLNNESAQDEETFDFTVQVSDGEGGLIKNHELAEGIITDDEGRATFSIAVAGMQKDQRTLDVPYGASFKIAEDKDEDPNNYATTINGEPGAEYEMDYVTDSEVAVEVVNAVGNVCRIDNTEFQTISSAMHWAQENGETDVTIEMIVDYTMPASDVVTIPAGYNVILSTASDYEGDGAATITRAVGSTGAMFVNRGTLNIADGRPGTRVTLDGNGSNVTATEAIITNYNTLNVCGGGTVRNANSSGDGGAINSSGVVNVVGGSLTGNRAANGGAIYTANNVLMNSGSITQNASTDKGGAIYSTAGDVKILTGSIEGNTAQTDGGAIYIESGAVKIDDGAIRRNVALTGNGGAIRAESGSVSVAGGELSGNAASNGNGGAIYAESGVSVSGGTIGVPEMGEAATDANRAEKGSAIYLVSGTGSFSGGTIEGNVASVGGAVNVAEEGARLFFSGAAYVQNNTIDGSNAVCNVYLDQDTDLIINAVGLSPEARIGIYVPGNDELYAHRGVSGARFGGYTNNENLSAFKNDRTPGMTVSEDNYKMQWGKAIKVELRELDSFSTTSLPPTAQGSLKKTGEYFPTANENYVSDIAAELLNTLGGITAGYTFAGAFGKGATQYADCLTKLDWNNDTGDWGFVNRAGEFVTYDTAPATLVIFYSAPAYLNVANNTAYPLNLTSLVVSGINVSSNAYGFVVARKGTTVEHFVPIESSDLKLDVNQSVKLMFPGARKQTISLGGKFADKTDDESVPYTYTEVSGTQYVSGVTKESTISSDDAASGFTVSGLHLYNNNNTVDIEFGTATKICKIVELNGDGTVKEEHLYPSIQAAVQDGAANYDAYKISVTEDSVTYDTVKVEMIQDYLMPSTDAPDIPTGKVFTFTTAVNGTTQGPTHYTGSGNRAVISQDQGNANSFFRASVGGDGTAITIENINFEGKQLDATKTNGGVISTRDCSVTIRHTYFSNFSAGNGGAVYAQFGTTDKSAYDKENNWVKISDTTFTNCVSKAAVDKFGGGGIWTNTENLVMSDCAFIRCNATQQGGAVYHRIDGDYSYTPTSITRVKNCKFEHCYAGAAGGLEINAVDVEIEGCAFDDCQAITRNGGGFNAYLRTNTTPNTSLRISNTTFNNCFANKDGGVFRTMMNTYVTNCKFTDNTANGLGGGIAQNNGNVLSLNGCTVTGNKSGEQGGGIYTNGNLTLENHCVITGNSLTTNVIGNGAGVYLVDNKTLTLGVKDAASGFLDTCTISDNVTADGSASNLKLPENNGVNKNAVIVRCNFTTGEEGDKLIHVLNANQSGTQFGTTSGVNKPNGFKEGEHIFVADNNELYGIYDRTTGNKIVWSGQPLCKITDGDGNLLYFDEEGKDPAIFNRLDNASGSADADGAFSYLKNTQANTKLYRHDGETVKRYEGGTFYVKMLVDEYHLTRYIDTNANNASWQTIVFTTETARDGLYPYRGNADTATIYRTASLGNNKAMLYVKSNVKLQNITLDGLSETITAANNTGSLISITNNGKFTAGNGAILQNSKTSQQRGTAIYAESKGVCEIEDHALIRNCVNTHNEGQGGAYFQKGNTSLKMSGGTVTGCSAKTGGGVFINNGRFYMSGGSIEDCTATNQGGAVGFANWNDPAPTVYMSGGSITNNHAANSGGAMAFVGTFTKVYFSGSPVIYDNTVGNSNTPCNVQLNQNSLEIINASGLGEGANIGIYTTGSHYNNYGVQGKDFGTWSDDAHLEMFVNDRDTNLRGAADPRNSKKIWWQKMQSLTVTKAVDSVLPSDKSKEFTFTVTLEQKNVNQSFGEMEFIDSVATFTLKHGQTKKAVYLPTANIVGHFTVEEQTDGGFNTMVNDDPGNRYYSGDFYSQQDVEADTGNTLNLAHVANFKNTRRDGDLTVSKDVVSDEAADEDLVFNFRVTLTPALNGTYGDLAFSNGTSTFTLKKGQHKTATGLPTGIKYTVTEASNSSFNTSTTVNGDEMRPEGVDLQAGANNVVVFTNTRKVGGIRLVKRVTSDASADKNVKFPISVELKRDDVPLAGSYQAVDTDGKEGEVTFDENGHCTFMLKDGDSITIKGLPQGASYNVTESVDGFDSKFVYTDESGKTDNSRIIGNDIVTCTVTNTRLTGSLKITKKLVSDRTTDDTNAQFTFVVTLGNTVDGVFVPDEGINKTYSNVEFTEGMGRIVVTKASPRTITRLPQGIEYRVTEESKEKFALTAVNDDTTRMTATGTIASTISEASFTNTRETGSLEITKTVVSEAAADLEKSFTFSVRLGDSKINKQYNTKTVAADGVETTGTVNFSGGYATGLSIRHGEKLVIEGLPTDVGYTVSEAAVSGFTTQSTGITGTIGETEVSVGEDEKAFISTAAFTNTRDVGNLTVKKTVSSDLLEGKTVQDKDKVFTFTVKLGSMNGDTFVVDESIGADAEDGKAYGDMKFKKGVATFTLKHGESITASNLPGDLRYQVTEQADPDFNTTSTGASGTISSTRDAVATFVNTRKTGKLVLRKTVVSDVSNDRSKYYNFTIKLGKTITGDGGDEFVPDTTLSKRYGSVTFANGVGTIALRPSTGTASTTLSNLPQGIEYQVTEAPVENMTATYTGETGTISASEDSTSTFTNTRDTGNLTVEKIVPSDLAADRNVEFIFTVKVGSVNATYSGVQFTNGTGTFKLTGGEKKTLEGLPAGISYTVTEAANSNFDTQKTGDKGTITKGITSESTFTNTRKTGDLRLTKRVVSDLAGDAQKKFKFTVELADKTIGSTAIYPNGKEFGGLTFKDGKATVALAKDESVTIEGLPTTVGYTVTEETVDGFTTVASDENGTVSTDRANVVFTNTRNTGDLLVTKKLDSDLAADAKAEFAFTVTLDDESIGAVTEAAPNGKTFGGMTFKNGVAEFKLNGGESVRATGLPAGIGYTVEEISLDDFETTSTNGEGKIPANTAAKAEFTNTRKTADLTIGKTVVTDLATDKTTYFKFGISFTGLSDAAKNKTYGDVTLKNGSATVTLQHGESVSLEGLPTGARYTVEEKLTTAQMADFTSDPQNRKLSDVMTGDVEAVFTNTRVCGDLVITKTVKSDLPADKDVEFQFEVTLSDKTIGATSDDDNEGKKYDYIVEHGEGEDKTTDQGKVEFKNGVSNVTLKDGDTLTIRGLPTDVRATVKEALTDEQKADYTTVPTNLTRSATIASKPVTTAFTNTRKTGKLKIGKTLSSAVTADKKKEYEFTISLGSLVEETDDEGQETQRFVVNEGISKTYGGIEFTSGVARHKLKGGESNTIDGLPKGLVYVVEEELPEDEQDIYTVSPDPARIQGVISNTATSVANIKNTRKTGDLVVAKKVENGLESDAGKSFSFTVQVGTKDADKFTTDAGVSGSYGDVTFRKGEATFSLKDGAYRHIKGLPIGLDYVVSEGRVDGFIPTPDREGTIVENTTTKDQVTGEETTAPGRSETVTNVRAICKITDDGGNLLYEDAEHANPTVYTELSTEVAAKIDGQLYKADGTEYKGSKYRIKMLVPEYALQGNVELGAENKTITLTTADTADTDHYPYVGDEGTVCKIDRGFNEASMFTIAGFVNLESITLDGNKGEYACDVDGGIINVVSGSLGIVDKAKLQNSKTNAKGGAVYVGAGAALKMNGGSIVNNQATIGGAVYVVGVSTTDEGEQTTSAATFTLTGGTITGNSATEAGAGIYLEEGSKLKLSGKPSFGGAGINAGNFKDDALADGATNGGESYARARQDIYLAGAADEGMPLTSITLAGNLNVAAGSIWVWAEGDDSTKPNHYYTLKQFAVLADDFTDVANKTYHAFRNARADADTDCGGDYLTGQTGDDIGGTKCIYWTGGYDVSFLKVDSYDQPLAGAKFSLYTSYKSKTENEPYRKGGEPVTAESSDGKSVSEYPDPEVPNKAQDKGIVHFDKIAPNVFYMVETDVPDGYVENTAIYRVTVSSDGGLKIEQKQLSDDDSAYVEVQKAPKKETEGAATNESGQAEEYQYHITNTPKDERKVILRKVSVRKVSDEGNDQYSSLGGAKFRIYRADWSEITDKEYESDPNSGVYFVGTLPYGRYYLVETFFPKGHEGDYDNENGFAKGDWRYYKLTVGDPGIELDFLDKDEKITLDGRGTDIEGLFKRDGSAQPEHTYDYRIVLSSGGPYTVGQSGVVARLQRSVDGGAYEDYDTNVTWGTGTEAIFTVGSGGSLTFKAAGTAPLTALVDSDVVSSTEIIVTAAAPSSGDMWGSITGVDMEPYTGSRFAIIYDGKTYTGKYAYAWTTSYTGNQNDTFTARVGTLIWYNGAFYILNPNHNSTSDWTSQLNQLNQVANKVMSLTNYKVVTGSDFTMNGNQYPTSISTNGDSERIIYTDGNGRFWICMQDGNRLTPEFEPQAWFEITDMFVSS